MAKVSKVESELLGAAKIKPKPNEKRPAFLIRLHSAIADLSDEAWDALSEPAQKWQNAATKANDADKPIPDFEEAKSAPAESETETPETKTADESEDEGEEEPEVTTKTKTEKKAPAEKPAPKAKAEKPEPKAKTKKAAGAAGKKGDGYKGHRAGSNKEQVHKVYDEKGAEAAIKLASKLGLSEGTPKSWISSWGGATKK